MTDRYTVNQARLDLDSGSVRKEFIPYPKPPTYEDLTNTKEWKIIFGAFEDEFFRDTLSAASDHSDSHGVGSFNAEKIKYYHPLALARRVQNVLTVRSIAWKNAYLENVRVYERMLPSLEEKNTVFENLKKKFTRGEKTV